MALDPEQKELWLRELRLNGFVILRGLLERELVQGMFDDLYPILLAEHKKAQKGESKVLRGPGRMAFDVKPYLKLLQGPLADPAYTRNPVIEELADAVLGTWTRGWTQVECCWKGSEYMHWHSDQTPEETPDMGNQTRTVRLTFNIPLVDFTWRNGAMEVLPGSHLLERSFQSFDFTALPRIYPVPLPVQRGDAVLRDGNILHRGTPNLTDVPRPMLDQTYKLAPAP